MRNLIVPATVALLLAACGRGPQLEQAAAGDPQLVIAEAGRFEIDSGAFVLQQGRIRLADESSVLELRLVDEAGRIHYQEEFERPEAAAYGLEFTIDVHGAVAHNPSGTGLLLTYEYLPSAPMTGVRMRGFGVRAGTLQPLWPALTFYGELQAPEDGPSGELSLLVWRYHYGAVVPLLFDWRCAAGAPDCVRVVPPRQDAGSGLAVFDVRTDLRSPPADDSVTLFAAPGADAREVVAVGTTSEIEVLEAAADVSLSWGEQLELVVRDEYLRVRIDGREGWIRGPEDFEAVGLPAAG